MSTQQAVVPFSPDATPAASAFGGGAAAFATAQRIAAALAASTIVPTTYQNNLPNVLVAMELANRIGASVLAVMQNMDVIHGRPSLRATFLIATVNASGRFTPVRFRWQGTEGKDDWGCRAVAADRESGEECVGALITIALAKSEGWYAKSGSKWKSIPEQMLMYRAAAFWTRVYSPELSLGMHTSDEIEDFGPQDVSRVAGSASTLNELLAASKQPKDDDELLRSLHGKYFALLTEHCGKDLPTDIRHEWQKSRIGKESTSAWTVSDYERAIEFVGLGDFPAAEREPGSDDN